MNKYITGVVVLIGFAVIRVVSTYSVLNSTYDEPVHIACGMEWLQWGTYTCELQHPPLARIAVALGPFLKGLRLAARLDAPDQRTRSLYEEGNAILYSEGHYWANLTWARLGVRFLFLCCSASSRFCGRAAGSAKPPDSGPCCCWCAPRRFWGTPDWRPMTSLVRPAPRSRCINSCGGWSSPGPRDACGGVLRPHSPSFVSSRTSRSWRRVMRWVSWS